MPARIFGDEAIRIPIGATAQALMLTIKRSISSFAPGSGSMPDGLPTRLGHAWLIEQIVEAERLYDDKTIGEILAIAAPILSLITVAAVPGKGYGHRRGSLDVMVGIMDCMFKVAPARIVIRLDEISK